MYPGVISGFAAFLVYANTFSADFAFDDNRAIKDNLDILPETPWTQLFSNDFWGTPLTHSGSHKSYRPLCVLTFRWNYWLGGLDPAGYHVVNVLLHTLATCLFVRLSCLFVSKPATRLLAGLIFALHPIHTEAVSGVVGRADVGSTVFVFASLLTYISHCRHRDYRPTFFPSFIYLALSLLFSLAAMLFKETGITVLGICALYDIFIVHRLFPSFRSLFPASPSLRRLAISLSVVTSWALVLLTFRIYSMGSGLPEFATSDNPAADSPDWLTRLLTFLYLPVVNLFLLIFPAQLSFDWSMDSIPLVESLFDYRNLFTLLFYSSLFIISIWCLEGLKLSSNKKRLFSNCVTSPSTKRVTSNGSLKGKPTHNKPSQHLPSVPPDSSLDIVVFSSLLTALPYLPCSNLLFYVGFVVAERVLYLPSSGLCLLLAHGSALLWSRFPRQRVPLTLALCILLAAFSVRTLSRNADWRDEESLYRAGIPINPAKAWANLANVLASRGLPVDAENAYRNALRHRGNMGDTWYNLGCLLQDGGRYEAALGAYREAVRRRPRMSVAHLNLGMVLQLLGRRVEAATVYRHAADIDNSGMKHPRLQVSSQVSALYNLGKLRHEDGDFQTALDAFREAVVRAPTHYQSHSLYNLLGDTLSKLGRHGEGEKWFRASLNSKPDHVPAYLMYAGMLARTGRTNEAEQMFQQAVQLDPRNSTTLGHYATFLIDSGRITEAVEIFESILEHRTTHEAAFNAANAYRLLGNNRRAEELYRLAVAVDPANARGYMNLGAILHLNKKFSEAKKMYEKALILQPGDTATINNLSKLETAMLNARFPT